MKKVLLVTIRLIGFTGFLFLCGEPPDDANWLLTFIITKIVAMVLIFLSIVLTNVVNVRYNDKGVRKWAILSNKSEKN